MWEVAPDSSSSFLPLIPFPFSLVSLFFRFTFHYSIEGHMPPSPCSYTTACGGGVGVCRVETTKWKSIVHTNQEKIDVGFFF